MVGYADVKHPYIRNMKNIISSAYKMPEDVLGDTAIVIAYFVPLIRELVKINAAYGELAFPQ